MPRFVSSFFSGNPVSPISPAAIVLYCGFLLTVTAFSVDITLPAFSLIAEDLQAPYASVQLIVPLFILSAGIGQLFCGPLSDRFGRRPVILSGLLVYSFGAFICLFASSIELLLAGRIVQGLGASVGQVVGRAVLRDLFSGNELARNMSLATMIFAFGPIVAPLLGVAIMASGSIGVDGLAAETWRYIFAVITAFGLALCTFGLLKLPETNAGKSVDSTNPARLLENARQTMTNPQSRFYVMMAGPIMGMMMTILVSIPRVFSEALGVETTLFAIYFALHGIGIIIGQMANRKMLPKLGILMTMRIASAALFVTTFAMLAVAYFGLMTALALTLSMIVFAISYLVVFSNATALALDPHPAMAGFVSSLFGFSAQLIGSIIAILTAQFIGGDMSPFIWTLLVLSGSVFAILLFSGSFPEAATVD